MVDSECIDLQWNPIPSNDVNGILMGYQINATLNGTLVSIMLKIQSWSNDVTKNHDITQTRLSIAENLVDNYLFYFL